MFQALGFVYALVFGSILVGVLYDVCTRSGGFTNVFAIFCCAGSAIGLISSILYAVLPIGKMTAGFIDVAFVMMLAVSILMIVHIVRRVRSRGRHRF